MLSRANHPNYSQVGFRFHPPQNPPQGGLSCSLLSFAVLQHGRVSIGKRVWGFGGSIAFRVYGCRGSQCASRVWGWRVWGQLLGFGGAQLTRVWGSGSRGSWAPGFLCLLLKRPLRQPRPENLPSACLQESEALKPPKLPKEICKPSTRGSFTPNPPPINL